MRADFTTYWVPAEGADLPALKARHQRVFPGNELSIVSGFVKVAVLDGEVPPPNASTVAPEPEHWEMG